MTESLSPAQAHALHVLANVLDPSFYLVGGVAIALRLRHRASHDLDLFSETTDPTDLVERVPLFGPDARIIERSAGTLHLEIAGSPVSLIKYQYPLLRPYERLSTIPTPTASTDDLIAMKLSAIGGRGARRDFWDLHALLAAQNLSLEKGLRLFQQKYRTHDVGHVVRSLAYFADAEAEPMPIELTREHWAQASSR